MNIEELSSRLIITSGDNLLAFDTTSGKTEAAKVPAPDLPPNLTKGQLEVLNKQDRTINAVAISPDCQHIAVSTENKQVVVFDASLNLKKNFIVNRTASKVVFTTSGDILVADRTGDVFLYQFGDEKSEPTLLLGHLSMILDMVLSDCGKYIVTCDRDEKIRVSRFPNTYNIVSYCLGHEEFVTTIIIVGRVLLSASGDGTVRIWDYLKGQELSVINANQFVSNASLLQRFSDEMDKEKVDVTALPITDMQTYSSDKSIFIAVSLLSYNAVQFYKLTLDTYHWVYLHNIQPLEAPNKFYLTTKLYIFDNCKCATYKLAGDSYQLDTTSSEIEDFYKNFKHILKITDNCITVLYKRKFDNVQEYLERKKLRLESNKK